METRFSELSRIRSINPGKKLVLVGGCYDLIHVGHVAYLEKCRELGDVLIVSASSDARIAERKGQNRPVIPQKQRVTMLSALGCVDYALIAPDPTSHDSIPTVRVIDELRPDIFATSDPRFSEYESNLTKKGVVTISVPEIRLTSTTEIIARIQA